jgi:hypothetical protein
MSFCCKESELFAGNCAKTKVQLKVAAKARKRESKLDGLIFNLIY